jgi:hypothetical protein
MQVEFTLTVSLGGASAALDAAAKGILRELVASELAHDLELVTVSTARRRFRLVCISLWRASLLGLPLSGVCWS